MLDILSTYIKIQHIEALKSIKTISLYSNISLKTYLSLSGKKTVWIVQTIKKLQ